MRGNTTRALALVAVVVVATVAVACSDDGGDEADDATDETATTTVTNREIPEGPEPEVTELSGGDGVYIGSPAPFEAGEGWVEEEFAAAGTATSYSVDGELTGDGMWTLAEGEEADYRTRVLVRRPEDPDDFSGVVVVEWLNVSGGVDADANFSSLGAEILRQGHAYVGVSAQLIGVEGGPVRVPVEGIPGAEDAGKGLVNIDPERYGELTHPGDAFANDIYTQVGRAVRAGDVLGDLEPTTVVAAGQSQSAFALVTYINGVQPLTEVFDGFLVHSRGATGFPVLAPGEATADITSALGGTPTTIRADLDVPVFDIQAENDVVGTFGSYEVRQADSDRFRLWEMAGTSHADVTLVGEDNAEFIDCGVPINSGPMGVIARAAFSHLVEWVTTGEAPPEVPLLELTATEPVEVARDPLGIALGGVRTPPVDVPTQILSGVAGDSPALICILMGSTRPMSEDQLSARYSSAEDYDQQYTAALDAAIEAGVVLEADREAMEDAANPDLVPG